jgi:hypothetical protein
MYHLEKRSQCERWALSGAHFPALAKANYTEQYLCAANPNCVQFFLYTAVMYNRSVFTVVCVCTNTIMQCLENAGTSQGCCNGHTQQSLCLASTFSKLYTT